MTITETPIITAHRYHAISYGHRVCGHEGKCRHLHGHNAGITFHCVAPSLDTVGRVIDFGVMKSKLCAYVEEQWDHKFLLWHEDHVAKALMRLHLDELGVVLLEFNPTAENLARELLRLGPLLLEDTGVRLIRVDWQETERCGVSVCVCV